MRDLQAESITSALVARGWTPAPAPALARKDVNTAVGPRTAHVMISPSDAAGNRSLLGSYISEGRNILAPCVTLVPASVEGANLECIVSEFVGHAYHTIADSYAVRLLDQKVAAAPVGMQL